MTITHATRIALIRAIKAYEAEEMKISGLAPLTPFQRALLVQKLTEELENDTHGRE